MSQKTNPKRILDNEAISVGRNIRVSPQKLNLVAQSIRGIEASKAIAYLTFSKKNSNWNNLISKFLPFIHRKHYKRLNKLIINCFNK